MATDVGRPAVAIKLTYIVSHPIQYQAPLLRRIAKEEWLNLRVVFVKVPTPDDCFDPGFERHVQWDVPLTAGYEHTSLAASDLFDEIKKADVIWLHGWGAQVMRKALVIANRLGIPVLMRGENCDLAMPDGAPPWGWLKRLYIGWILRRCQAFLAIGKENKNYYLRRGVCQNKIFMMPYAIDNENFGAKAKAAYPQRNAIKASFGIGAEQKIILYIGKFMRRKHPELLVHAVNSVDWPNGKPLIIFVGSGEMESRLRSMAPDAVFPGFKNQSELPPIYAMADVLVIPSEREPWGLVVNEAMACGTAVIASDQVGCAPDLINDDCGRVFPSGDVAALAKAVIYCLKNSENMGNAAISTIKQWGFDKDIAGLKQAINYIKSSDDANS